MTIAISRLLSPCDTSFFLIPRVVGTESLLLEKLRDEHSHRGSDSSRYIIPSCRFTEPESQTNIEEFTDAVPPSLISAFKQNNAFNSNEPPLKRRKVAASAPCSLAQQRGLTATGVPLGYIPLARLALRMVSIKCHPSWRRCV